ncbi:hypothetical protein N018_08990 [Pseudomonas syringae CC1557]|uniref:Uncharacterized protein n=1 Tax=Pseudomonas syringae CC1557 TaxID=1357279 RepID=W0MYM7_PSESX|nr:hypothetical protein N018_08990 [Pseudomonas syringae CC1557]
MRVAQAWIKKHEAELNAPGVIERIDRKHRKAISIKQIIDRCLDEYEKARPLGKTARFNCIPKRADHLWLDGFCGALTDFHAVAGFIEEDEKHRIEYCNFDIQLDQRGQAID